MDETLLSPIITIFTPAKSPSPRTKVIVKNEAIAKQKELGPFAEMRLSLKRLRKSTIDVNA